VEYKFKIRKQNLRTNK